MPANTAGGPVERLAQAIASRVVNLVVEAVDVNAIVQKVDVNALAQKIDIEKIVETIDVDRIVDRVDIDHIVKRVDIEEIVDRIDIDAIVQRLDINAIVQRVDVNAIVQDMDIDALVEKTELGSIIAKSTTGIFTEVLDVIRAQGVGLDDFWARWTNRLLRRSADSLPLGPGMEHRDATKAAHVSPGQETSTSTQMISTAASLSMPPAQLTVERQGQYAGAASRLAAFAADVAASWGIYVGVAALLSFAIQLVTVRNYDVSKHPIVAITTLVLWAFVYFAYQWSVAGRTIGMAVFGIRVVLADGSPTTSRAGTIRALALPLSLALWPLGLVGVLTNRNRQTWHDRLAGTAVVYAWDARAARLRWLADRGGR